MSGQKVDDNDGSIVYSGLWSSTSSAGAFNNTLHETTKTGASASMTFTGISVTVVGTVPPCTTDGATVIYQVVMDGATVQSYSFVCTSQTQNNVVFYSSETINDGSHQITITYEGGSLPLMLDQMETTTSGSLSATSLASSGVSTSASSSTGLALSTSATSSIIDSLNGVTTPGPTTASDSNSLSQTASNGSGSHLVGPILGGILAAIVVIFTLLLLLLYRRRRIDGSLSNNSPKGVTPFHLDQRSFQERDDSSLSTRPSSICPQQLVSSFSGAQMQSTTYLVEKAYIHEEGPSYSPPFSPAFPESAFTSDDEHASGQRSPRTRGPHLAPQTQPQTRHSISASSPSSISHPEASPPHARAHNIPHYHSGVSTAHLHTSHTLDGPPSYNDCCVRNVGSRNLPELPRPRENSRIVTDASRLV